MIERLHRASLLSLVLLALGASGCTVDDDSVENKPCTPVGADPNKDCVKGYECLCPQGECKCHKIQTLLQPPPTSMNIAPRSGGSLAPRRTPTSASSAGWGCSAIDPVDWLRRLGA